MATDINGVVLGPTPPGVPHLTIPFTILSDGTASVVQQDTTTEIVQSVGMLVGSRPGERLMVPNYGVADPTFDGLGVQVLKQAAGRWEKRASVGVQTTPGNTETVVVTVAGGTSP